MNPPPQEIKASLYQQLVLFPVYLCLCHHPGFIVISSEDTKQHWTKNRFLEKPYVNTLITCVTLTAHE